MANYLGVPGERARGPKDLVCDSCSRTEFLLNTVVFSDGQRFRLCGVCADDAHLLGLEVQR